MVRKIFCIVLLSVMSASLSYAAPADIPKSGQTTVSATGDDGDLQKGVAWPGTRFTTNADTTVTDNLTGLVWAPNGNVMPTRDNGWDADGMANDGAVTWQHALDYVVKLNAESYLGRTDWRLPNVNELESLVHAEYTNAALCGGGCSSNAAWLNTQGFSNVQQTASYWSSTTFVNNTTGAWLVNTIDGGVFARDKAAFNYSVLPVRAGQ